MIPAATVAGPEDRPNTPRFPVMNPPLKFPLASRLTIAFAASLLVGATFQFRFSVPLLVTGEPVTLKSEDGALRPTLVTVPAPGKVCPVAKVNSPLLLSFSPVSAGEEVPEPKSRLSVPDGVEVLLLTASAFHWKVWFTANLVLLLNDEATRS